jgi:hypothetical protein
MVELLANYCQALRASNPFPDRIFPKQFRTTCAGLLPDACSAPGMAYLGWRRFLAELSCHAAPTENHSWGNAVVRRPRPLLVYCGDYKCAHSVVISAERWPDHVRLSDLEPKFTCQVCGHADLRWCRAAPAHQSRSTFSAKKSIKASTRAGSRPTWPTSTTLTSSTSPGL